MVLGWGEEPSTSATTPEKGRTMFGPITLFDMTMYECTSGGAEQKYYSDLVPFARGTSILIASLNIRSLTPNAQVSLYLEHSLDGVEWEALETMTSAGPIAVTGYTSYSNTKDYGPFLRFAVGVDDSTTTGIEQAQLQVRVYGKPIGV